MRTTASPAAPLLALLAMLAGCSGDDLVEPTVDVELAASSQLASGSQLAAPSGLSASAGSETRIALAWRDNSTAETGFELFRSASQTGPFGVPSLISANATALSIESLQPGSQYCFKLRAIRRSGAKTVTSEFSNTACATTLAPPPLPPPPPPPPPATVEGLAVTPLTSTSVGISWGYQQQTQYRVERSQDGGASWVLITGYTTDSGLVSEQQVCYRIIAYNAGGEAAPSAPDCTTPPAAPTGLVGTLREGGGVDFRWNDNSAVEDGYEVWVQELIPLTDCDAGCYTMVHDYVAADLPPNATSFTCGGDCVGWPVYVKAKKDGGTSDSSNQVQVP